MNAEAKVLKRIGWRPNSIDMAPMHRLWEEAVRLQSRIDEIQTRCEARLPAETVVELFRETTTPVTLDKA